MRLLIFLILLLVLLTSCGVKDSTSFPTRTYQTVIDGKTVTLSEYRSCYADDVGGTVNPMLKVECYSTESGAAGLLPVYTFLTTSLKEIR